MASVAGLAPARTSLKNWTRELLCIHGLEIVAAENENTKSQARRPALTLWPQFLRGVKDGLAAELARLVCEERSQRRDDGHESGSNEVFDHSLNVFVSSGRFLVEEVALFADDATTEAGLGEFSHAKPFAHAKPSFAASPLAAGTVCQ